MSNEKMVAPNKLKEALLEIKGLEIDSKVTDAMKQIKESEKGHYYCLGITSKAAPDGLSMKLSAKPVYANYRQWEKMKKQVEQNLFPEVFGGQFKKVVIFNDPTYIPKKKPATKKTEPKIDPAQ